MTTVWRICKKRHAATAFSGEGTRRAGGRWNHRGTPLVYTSQAASLAVVEMLVWMDPEDAKGEYVLIGAELPHDLPTITLRAEELPSDWKTSPAPESTRDVGDAWVREGRSAVLVVPSVIVPQERNYLLNPTHPHLDSLRLRDPEPFAFDPRLWSTAAAKQ